MDHVFNKFTNYISHLFAGKKGCTAAKNKMDDRYKADHHVHVHTTGFITYYDDMPVCAIKGT